MGRLPRCRGAGSKLPGRKVSPLTSSVVAGKVFGALTLGLGSETVGRIWGVAGGQSERVASPVERWLRPSPALPLGERGTGTTFGLVQTVREIERGEIASGGGFLQLGRKAVAGTFDCRLQPLGAHAHVWVALVDRAH